MCGFSGCFKEQNAQDKTYSLAYIFYIFCVVLRKKIQRAFCSAECKHNNLI